MSPSRRSQLAKEEGRSKIARTLFDCNLPQDALELIVRSLSARPHFACPQVFVDPSDALAALGASQPLRSAAQRYFRSVAVLDKPDRNAASWNAPCEYAAYDMERESAMLYVQDCTCFGPKPTGLYVKDQTLFEPLLAALSGTLRELTVFHTSDLTHSWIDVLAGKRYGIIDLTLQYVTPKF